MLILLVLILIVGDIVIVKINKENLYCHTLEWGMTQSQVFEGMTVIGQFKWNKGPTRGDVEELAIWFTNPFVNHFYGGLVVLHFHSGSYYSAFEGGWELKTICKKPE